MQPVVILRGDSKCAVYFPPNDCIASESSLLLQQVAVLAQILALRSMCLVMQCSIPGFHYHICLDHLPVGATQSVDDAMDSTQNRRGQPPMLMYWLICLMKDPSSKNI